MTNFGKIGLLGPTFDITQSKSLSEVGFVKHSGIVFLSLNCFCYICFCDFHSFNYTKHFVTNGLARFSLFYKNRQT